jgi:DNA-binding beta-propeller fold protein YncE
MILRASKIPDMRDCNVIGTRFGAPSPFSCRAACRMFATAALVAGFAGLAWASTFGTVVRIRGHVSDIALDEGRGVVYAANFTANRVEVISTANLSLRSPIQLQSSPLNFSPLGFSTLALSPDGRYLVVGQYTFPLPPPFPLTIIDLVGNTRQTVDLNGASVLSVAFGSSPRALVTTVCLTKTCASSVQLLDPASGVLQQLATTGFDSSPLPAPWATFPPEIVSATAGVSGDGQVIYVLWVSSSDFGVLRYEVSTGKLLSLRATSSPPQGPRLMSVDRTGSTYLAGWALFNYNRYTFSSSQW